MGGNKNRKLDSHLSQNLKKKIKELNTSVEAKQSEIETLKRNIKVTKIAEIEA